MSEENVHSIVQDIEESENVIKKSKMILIWFFLSYLIVTVFSAIFIFILGVNTLDTSDPEFIKATLLSLFFDFIFKIFVILIPFGLYFYKKDFQGLKQFKLKDYILAVCCFIFMFCLSPLFSYLKDVLKLPTSENQQLINTMFKNSSWPFRILLGVNIIFSAPIFEELAFRTGIFNLIIRDNNSKSRRIIALISSTLIFALIHMLGDPSLISSPLAFLINSLEYIVLSFPLCFLYYKTNNVLASTTLHFLNNFIGFIMLLF